MRLLSARRGIRCPVARRRAAGRPLCENSKVAVVSVPPSAPLAARKPGIDKRVRTWPHRHLVFTLEPSRALWLRAQASCGGEAPWTKKGAADKRRPPSCHRACATGIPSAAEVVPQANTVEARIAQRRGLEAGAGKATKVVEILLLGDVGGKQRQIDGQSRNPLPLQIHVQ
jgi:hypothetical protein